jgi:hypothetical protein
MKHEENLSRDSHTSNGNINRRNAAGSNQQRSAKYLYFLAGCQNHPSIKVSKVKKQTELYLKPQSLQRSKDIPFVYKN